MPASSKSLSVEEQLLAVHKILEEQRSLLNKQGQTIREQGEKILKLEKKASEGEVKTEVFVRRWRFVFVLGALVPHGFALASLIDGDMRLVAAAKMFQMFGIVCSLAAAFGNPRNFGKRSCLLYSVHCCQQLIMPF